MYIHGHSKNDNKRHERLTQQEPKGDQAMDSLQAKTEQRVFGQTCKWATARSPQQEQQTFAKRQGNWQQKPGKQVRKITYCKPGGGLDKKTNPLELTLSGRRRFFKNADRHQFP